MEIQVVVCTAYSDYSWDGMRAKVGQPDSLLVLKSHLIISGVTDSHALTQKWLLNFQARQQISELSQANESLLVLEERFSKAFHESRCQVLIKFSRPAFCRGLTSAAGVTGFSRSGRSWRHFAL